jgi:hypothetical protein
MAEVRGSSHLGSTPKTLVLQDEDTILGRSRLSDRDSSCNLVVHVATLLPATFLGKPRGYWEKSATGFILYMLGFISQESVHLGVARSWRALVVCRGRCRIRDMGPLEDWRGEGLCAS